MHINLQITFHRNTFNESVTCLNIAYSRMYFLHWIENFLITFMYVLTMHPHYRCVFLHLLSSILCTFIIASPFLPVSYIFSPHSACIYSCILSPLSSSCLSFCCCAHYTFIVTSFFVFRFCCFCRSSF